MARGYLELADIAEEDEERYSRWKEHYEKPYGIAYELMEAACGPDVAEVSEDERRRRLEEFIAPAIHGEKGYRISRHMKRMKEGETK